MVTRETGAPLCEDARKGEKMFEWSLLQANAAGQAGMVQVGLLVLMVLVMYVLIIRPQQKRQKELRQMMDNLKKGDKIITIGGIHGQIEEVKERTVIIRVDAQTNTRIEFVKSAISEVKGDPKEQEAKSGETK